MEGLKPLVLSELSPPLKVTFIHDDAGLSKLEEFAQRMLATPGAVIGFDTETNKVNDFWRRRVRTIQIGTKDEQYVIDLLAFAGSKDALIESQGMFGDNNGSLYARLLSIISPLLCTDKVIKAGTNLGFEYEVMYWNFGVRIWGLFDISLVERVLKAGAVSLKKYDYYSLEQIVGRYAKLQIDKTLQASFDLESELTTDQINYAVLDVRLPIAVRGAQLRHLTKDQLLTTAKIENDAIGSFIDMHLNGQRIDEQRWLARLEKVRARRIEELQVIDQNLIPVVGHKDHQIDYEELNRREDVWRNGFEIATPEELAKAAEIRAEKDGDKKAALRAELATLKKQRARRKQVAHASYMDLSKKRTEWKNKYAKCQGDAYINLNSNDQLLEALKQIKGLKSLAGTSDDDLLKFNDMPFIQTLRKYKKGNKELTTYGETWIKRWINKPCKEEGWLHPMDGRLHCKFNQLEAETGRTSSSQPNGQNLPKGKEVNSCFIADATDESIRISCCCDSETLLQLNPCDKAPVYFCTSCGHQCETKGEEYCIITIDMSGAELRIVAELSGETSWIKAFQEGKDLHSICTEILYPKEWAEEAIPGCEYYAINPATGEPSRLKCECPAHKKRRQNAKAINFGLLYGGGPKALADELGISIDEARALMRLHQEKFPILWAYLQRAGDEAKEKGEARDMYGRRRLFTEPTFQMGLEYFSENYEEDLEIPEEDAARAIFKFQEQEKRPPTEDELWSLTHRPPTEKEAKRGMREMYGSIERQGKNHGIQGTNASMIKRAMGCGFDKDGNPYLWHILPKYKAKLRSMIHDELQVGCPKRLGQKVADILQNAFRRAAAEVMNQIYMESDYHIGPCWMK